jgi:hypothetical protein
MQLLYMAQSISLYLSLVLSVGALAIAALAYHWDAAPWLNLVALVGLTLCTLRLLYWHTRSALVIPRQLSDDAAPPLRFPALWPTLLTLSSLAALVVAIAGLITGHAPHDTWTNVEVIGGAALFAIGGALMAWARISSTSTEPTPEPTTSQP